MQIILNEDIASLGYKDDVVTVKDGYGRNYLIPQGLAVIASASALKVLAENKKQRAHKLAKIKADAEAIAAAVAELKVVITAKASENGTIYGGINNAKVSEALAALGQEIDRKKIIVKEVHETIRCCSRFRSIHMSGIVFNTGTKTGFSKHLNIEVSSLRYSLCFN